MVSVGLTWGFIFSVCLTLQLIILHYITVIIRHQNEPFKTDFEKKADWYEIYDQDHSGVWQTSSKRVQSKQGSVCIETWADQINQIEQNVVTL